MDRLNIYYTVIYFFIFLFGVCVGSFLNVCIYRLPKNEGLIKRNSHCMTCGEEIKRRDLIPIISWCLLRGKCRNCGAKISPRYTVVEALNGVLWLFTALWFDIVARPMYIILTCLMISALVVVFFMDWDTQLINTWVVVFIAVLAVLEIILCRNNTGLEISSHIIGAFAVSIPLMIVTLISKEKAMGWGDVYLMAAGGLYLGTQGILVALGVALISGSICGLAIKHFSGNSKFAFGPYLSLGILVAVFWGASIGDWYMEFTGLNEMLA
ncbi:MAG: prepilin peptidase [Ruminococcus sp.]|nr:prepilin peptidase [Ruminococcus sp.]